MKQKLLLKAMLLLCALVAGSSSVWAQADPETLFHETFGNNEGSARGWSDSYSVKSGVAAVYSGITGYTVSNAKQGKNTTGYTKSGLNQSTQGTDASIIIGPLNVANYITLKLTYQWKAGSVKGTYSTSLYYKTSSEGSFTEVSGSGAGATTFVERSYSLPAAAQVSTLYLKIVWNTSNTQAIIDEVDLSGVAKGSTPEHTATFSVNGVTNSTEYIEGADIVFPSDPSDIGEKKFMGWATAAIDGTTDVAPAFVSSATMGTSAVTFYAVFASQTDVAGNKTLTINKDTENFPTVYGTANTFTEYTLEGKKFKIQQGYINGEKLQWRAAGNSNGTGTMYNTEVLNNIQSIVLTYDASDGNKNFTVEIGDTENPTGSTAITPLSDDNVYTFNCSKYNKNYFVLTNGSNAGYLTSIAITYESFATRNVAYCTTVAIPSTVSVTIAASGYSTIASGWGLDFSNAYPADLEAYVASALSASAVTLNAIDEAPAGIGVILKGTAGETYTIPIKADATFDGTNKLQAAVYSTGVDANSAYILKGGKFCLVTNASLVPAGKAYLLKNDIPAAASAPGYLGFDFGSTNISTTNFTNDTNNSGEFYNLAGQRVANPTKGLYIVNGKKVIVK